MFSFSFRYFFFNCYYTFQLGSISATVSWLLSRRHLENRKRKKKWRWRDGKRVINIDALYSHSWQWEIWRKKRKKKREKIHFNWGVAPIWGLGSPPPPPTVQRERERKNLIVFEYYYVGDRSSSSWLIRSEVGGGELGVSIKANSIHLRSSRERERVPRVENLVLLFGPLL